MKFAVDLNGVRLGVASSAYQTEEAVPAAPSSWDRFGRDSAKSWVRRVAKKGLRLRFGGAPVPDWGHLLPLLSAPANYVKGDGNQGYSDWRGPILLAHRLGQQIYRFSILWQRIMPVPGQPDLAAIEHYRQVVELIHECGMEAWITIWHFDEPPWFTDKGSWEAKTAPADFAAYVSAIMPVLIIGDHVTVLNEPNWYAFLTRIAGAWPPNKIGRLLAHEKVCRNLAKAHRAARVLIKAQRPNLPVSTSISTAHFEAAPGITWPINYATSRFIGWFYNHSFLARIRDQFDTIDLQYYQHRLYRWGLTGLKLANKNDRLDDFGHELWPQGLEHLLLEFQRKYGLPIAVTEFGVADLLDRYRPWYIKSICHHVCRAKAKGAKVIALLYWSLEDNFEWGDHGYACQMGLHHVDRRTLRRRARPSAELWEHLARHGKLPED